MTGGYFRGLNSGTVRRLFAGIASVLLLLLQSGMASGDDCEGMIVKTTAGPYCTAPALCALGFKGNAGARDPRCRKIPGCEQQPGQASSVCWGIPIDPNDKTGTQGLGQAQYLAGTETLSYQIHFENLAAATAAAQQVVVTDQLNPQLVDLNTFSLGPIWFGSTTVAPPSGLSQFSRNVDLRPAQNLLVRLDASLNKTTGVLTWRFSSVDPATLQFTQDPTAGFLPPNVNPPAGEGAVSFTVNQKQGFSTGTQIQNQASVVFDLNAPIATPVWSNTIDRTPPVTRVLPLPATESTAGFLVQWTGTDVGSGIDVFSIYVSDNGGAFTPWLTNTTATQGTYSGVGGHTYGFYSIARDLVGNVESAKSAAEATTTVSGQPSCAFDATNQFKITRSGFRFDNGTQRFLQTVTLQQLTLTPIQLPLALVLDNLSSNAMLFNNTGDTACAAPLGSPYINVPSESPDVTL